MGRGSSKAGSGGGVFQAVKSLNIAGDNIDLSETPLKYGNKDKALTGKARETIEAFENKKYKLKREQSCFITANGDIVEENRGGKGSVSASLRARMTADAMTHNHPRDPGVIGGTFSDADISNFSRFHQKTYRATCKEGTYSISKGKNFNGAGLSSDYKKSMSSIDRTYKKQRSDLTASYRSGKISYDEYAKKWNSNVNGNLVAFHNWLIDNQSKYGYSYTLERRS